MRIDSNSNLQGPKELGPTGSQPKPVAKTDQADFVASEQLVCNLDATVEVRADAVARARALIENPDYPDDATVRAVSKVIAEHLKPSAETQSRRDGD
jgi:hypothetical protein